MVKSYFLFLQQENKRHVCICVNGDSFTCFSDEIRPWFSDRKLSTETATTFCSVERTRVGSRMGAWVHFVSLVLWSTPFR